MLNAKMYVEILYKYRKGHYTTYHGATIGSDLWWEPIKCRVEWNAVSDWFTPTVAASSSLLLIMMGEIIRYGEKAVFPICRCI